MLSREAILAADDITIVEVACPEFGGTVGVRLMSVRQRWQYLQAIRPLLTSGDATATDGLVRESGVLLAAFTICDATGAPLFTPADVETLAAKSWKAMSRVIDAAAELNGLSAKAVEDTKKNSAAETPILALSTV